MSSARKGSSPAAPRQGQNMLATRCTAAGRALAASAASKARRSDSRCVYAPPSRRSRHGIPGHRARVIDGAERRDPAHDRSTPREGSDRQATADDFAERHEIGRDVDRTAEAVKPKAKPRDHLVEYQQRAVARAEL